MMLSKALEDDVLDSSLKKRRNGIIRSVITSGLKNSIV